MDTQKVIIKEIDEHAELISAALLSFNAIGVEEQQHTLIGYFNTDEVTIQQLNNFLTQLQSAHKFTYQIQFQQARNWNKEWEANYQPILIGDFCYVRASFHPAVENVQHTILVNPRMAFGTGHHETTFLMMKAIEQLNITGKKILDLGCGTGILSILCEKVDAEDILSVDIDPIAIDNLKDNIRCNNSKKITSLEGTIHDVKSKFDFIFANINRNVLLEEAEQIVQQLNQNSKLILSGFYEKDGAVIREKYEQNGLQWVASENKNGWLCVIYKKVGKKFEV